MGLQDLVHEATLGSRIIKRGKHCVVAWIVVGAAALTEDDL